MEMKASEARTITDNHEHFSSDIWFMEYKYKLFDKIKGAALKGNETIQIFGEDWGGNATKKKYLLFNLEALGYRIIEKDEPRENIIIVW